jgi:N-methylhydantoinase A
MRLGVDVGGTFTDAVLVADGRLHTGKAPTTPADQSRGVLDAVEVVLDRAGAEPGDVRSFAHGMTVTTNALLEGRGARTALLATEGFRDLVALGRQARPHLYRLCDHPPAPLAPPELRRDVPERTTPDGPVRALDEPAAVEMLGRLAGEAPEAVAVVLLHAYAHPQHERRLGELVAAHLPGVHVSLSHEVVGTFREFERAATTEVDAALSPLLAGYIERMVGRGRERGLPAPSIMQSSGGLASAAAATAHAAVTVLSGPAGGAAGAALLARAAGHPDALCLDMGGTSCDVCVVEGGSVRETTGGAVAGRPLALPMLDVHTVGAGGGSIAWRDPGGALQVGPHSAGADPGPACYGRGGSAATVTDANLVLGYLDETAPLAGGVRLQRARAHAAVSALAGELGMEPVACAEGIVRVANAEMVRALRVMTVERGVDPRRHCLLAFGGAGPLHAAALAEALEIERVLCPRASGVLSALGLAAAERRADAQRSLLRPLVELDEAALSAEIDALARRASETLGGEGAVRAELDLRYRGQSFELTIPGGERPAPAALAAAFEAAHRERYGFSDPEGEIELVTVRASVRQPAPEIALAAGRDRPGDRASGGAGEARRESGAYFGGRAWTTTVLTGPPAEAGLDGPAVIALDEATVVVPPGWRARADAAGTSILERT